MTCGPASPGTPWLPWSPSWPRCAPGPAAPSATPPASRCASWDGARSSSTASSSASTSSSSPSSPPAPPGFSPSTGSAPTPRRCCSSQPGTTRTAALRGRLGAPVRRRPDPGLLGQDRPPPAQPRRRPPGQPRPVADRVHPHGLSPGHPRLRRTPHRRREIQEGDHPLPEALRRPRGLPPPPRRRRLTHTPGGGLARYSAAAPAGLRTIRRPSPGHH